VNNISTENDRPESLNNMNKYFEFIPCSMLIANSEGTIVRCNSACLDLLGSENPLVGYRLFNDPNFTPSLIAQFTSESEFSVSIPYDFAKVTYSTCLREKQKNIILKVKSLQNKGSSAPDFLVCITECALKEAEELPKKVYSTEPLTFTKEELLKIAELIPDLIFIVDKDLYYRKSFAYGAKQGHLYIAEDEILNKHVTEVLPTKQARLIILAIQAAFKHHKSTKVKYSLHIEGKDQYYMTRVIPFNDTSVFMMVQCITGSHESEMNVQMLAYAVNHTNEKIMMLDNSGAVLYASNRLKTKYGLKKTSNNYPSALFSNLFQGDSWEAIKKQLETSEFVKVEDMFTNKDGTESPMELYFYKVLDIVKGNMYWCFARNITERYTYRKEIEWVNRLMTTILDSLPLAIGVKSVNDDFRYVYFNAEAKKVLHMIAEEVVGKTDFDLFPDSDFPYQVRTKDLLAIEKGIYSEYAVPFKGLDGANHIMNRLHIYVNNPDNPQIVSVFWDVTEQYNNEVELIKEREKNSLKSAFLANISHEIRTPLNAITGFSELMCEADQLEEKTAYKQQIRENNERLLNLIDDMLLMSEIDSDMAEPTFAQVPVKTLCHNLFIRFSGKEPNGVSFTFDVENSPECMLLTDELMLERVLIYLLENAFKFTHQGTVKLSYHINSEHETSKMVVIEVADTGIGIDPAYSEQIYEQFFKIEKYSQGPGLGLTLAKRIIHLLGGSISFEANEGGGTLFQVKLPLE
jgi:PAS domain S-box-containing protein